MNNSSRQSDTRPRSSRRRFSLLALLLAVMMVAAFSAGWGAHRAWSRRNIRQAISDAVLGFQNICPIPEKFALAVADWQDANGLDDDGKLGPNTWKKMKLAAGIKPKLSPKSSSPLAVSGSGPVWLHVAQAERNHWDTAIAGMSKAERKIAEFHMTRDEEYFMASPYFWPTRGQANCNHVPGTEEGHYCGSIHS